MAEITLKIDVPTDLKEKFEFALNRVVNQFVREIEFSISNEILSKSELTEKEAVELGNNLKKRVARKHNLG